MLNHRERDEEIVLSPIVAEANSSPSSSASSAVPQSSSNGEIVDSVSDYTFTPKQPSHLIRHTRKLGKRRLPVESSGNLVRRDSSSSNDAESFSVLTNLQTLSERLWSWTDEDGKEEQDESIEKDAVELVQEEDNSESIRRVSVIE